MKERGFLLASMRAQRGISEWIAKTSHWKARRFDGENIVGLVGTLCGFYSLTETGRIGDRKTERAFNEHGLMSEANRHYTRVSLDQSWWKWSLLNEENISRQSILSPALSYAFERILYPLNSFDKNIISSCVQKIHRNLRYHTTVRKIFLFFISTRIQGIREFENVNKTCH